MAMKKILGLSAPVAIAGIGIGTYFALQNDGTRTALYNAGLKGLAITGLYLQYLKRAPDSEGYNFWVRDSNTGKSYEEIKDKFLKVAGPEMTQRGLTTV